MWNQAPAHRTPANRAEGLGGRARRTGRPPAAEPLTAERSSRIVRPSRRENGHPAGDHIGRTGRVYGWSQA